MDMPGEEEEYVYEYDNEFDLENPFTSPADEPIASLLDAEGHHSPSVSAAASAVRRDAAGFIAKVLCPLCGSFFPSCGASPSYFNLIGPVRRPPRCATTTSSPFTRGSPTSP
jgi:hypothetical protein